MHNKTGTDRVGTEFLVDGDRSDRVELDIPGVGDTAWQAVIDAVPAIINAKDRASRYLFMNQYQADLYGVAPAEAVGQTADSLLGTVYGTYTRKLDERVIRTGEATPYFEEEFEDRQGVKRTLLTTKVPLRGSEDHVSAVVTVSLDISERKQAEAALSQSETLTRQTMTILTGAIESMNDGFILFDDDDQFVMCNQRYRQFYPEVEDLLAPGSRLEDIIVAYADRVDRYRSPEEKAHFVKARRLAWKSGYAMAELTPSGRWIETRDQITDRGYWVGICIDITKRKQAEAALEMSEQRYRSLFESAPLSLWEEDWSGVKERIDELRAEGNDDLVARFKEAPSQMLEALARVKVVDVNEATLRLYRAESKEALVSTFNERVTVTPCPSFEDQLLHLVQGVYRVVTECDDMRLDGSRFYQRVTLEVPDAHRGDWKRVFTTVEDITEAKALSRELEYQATHDALTDLVNRREFEHRLERVLGRVDQERSEHAVCYLDLDQFKVVNDTCGHVAGDELLRRLGHLLAERVRSRDTLARLGGDEFGVLLEHCPLDQALEIANVIKDVVEEFRFDWEGQSFGLGVSIGLVPIRGGSQSTSAVMSAADSACYAAKDQGRNRIHVYDEADADLLKRYGEMQWVARTQRALEENRFELARQPIVPVPGDGDGPEMHYEVLIRLRDEDGQLVMPGAFLPAAERYNLSAKLDRWVVRSALGLLAEEEGRPGRAIVYSINLSALTLADETFLEFVLSELRAHQVPPQQLCFEITETAAIANLAGATDFMLRLREHGCRFALDDFGSGLSSFAYLKCLPVDYLKIDGLFVKDIVDDPIDRAMVKSINEIGHTMGKLTIAEFVESEAILEVLRDLGVDYAQGYHIGKPSGFTRSPDSGDSPAFASGPSVVASMRPRGLAAP